MKTKFIVVSVFAAVSGLAGLANPASAGTDFRINIGIGARPGPVIIAPRCEPVVVVPASPAYGYGYGYGRSVPVPVYRDACPLPAPAGPVLPTLIIVISAMAAVVANPPHGIHSDQTTPLP